MAVKVEKKISKQIMKKKRQDTTPRHLPVKRTINLATVGEEKINIKVAVPGIVIIILAAVFFGKFTVADRLIAVSVAQYKAELVREQLDAGYQKIQDYGDISEEYAHYTYSGFTEEELNRVDRNDVLDLMKRVVLPQVVVSSWSIQDNEMTLVIGGSTLQQINLLVQKLEVEELVDFCTVETAVSNAGEGESVLSAETKEAVTAQLTVYLKNALKEDE
ncbi:MAG: hypothetical protein ACI39H_02645 [Lachnospiraceae bacterium]